LWAFFYALKTAYQAEKGEKLNMELEQNEVVEQDTTAGETSEETSQDSSFLDALNDDESTNEEESESQEDSDDESESESPQADEPKYQIRVDHQDHELTLDELKVAAQKGMAFDRLKGNYDEVKVHADRLTALAQKQNTTVEDLITQAEIGYMESVLGDLTEQYIEQGYDEEVAETLALKDLEILGNNSEAEYQEEADEFAERVNYEAEQFMTFYPNVNPDDIPEEVFESINQYGMSLVEAYQHYEIQQLKAQAAVKELNAKNASNAVGSARDSKRTQKKDDFLSEFMKE
jgi:hypothetical protein